jgi:hypothetical protein
LVHIDHFAALLAFVEVRFFLVAIPFLANCNILSAKAWLPNTIHAADDCIVDLLPARSRPPERTAAHRRDGQQQSRSFVRRDSQMRHSPNSIRLC